MAEDVKDESKESAEDRRDRLQGLRKLRPDMYARLVNTGRAVQDEEIE